VCRPVHPKFYQYLALIEDERKLLRAMLSLVSFFEGGVDYNDLKNMPIPELMVVNEEANRLNEEKKKSMKAPPTRR